MKKAFSTVACMQATVDQVLETGRRYKMEGVEIRLGDRNAVLGVTGPAEVEAVGQKLQAAGMAVTNLGSSICIRGYEETAFAGAAVAIDLAARVRARGIRVFLGNFPEKNRKEGHGIMPGEAVACRDVDYEGTVRMLQRLCMMAQEREVEIWVETHNEFSTGRTLQKLLGDVACGNLRLIWDIMHPVEAGECPEETWGRIKKWVAHVHVKDGFADREGVCQEYEYTRLGEGALPVFGILDLLQREGYQGYVSFEWESPWRDCLKGYPNTLDWVLGQYAAFWKRWEQNPVPGPGACWRETDAPGKHGSAAFFISPKKTMAVIDNRGAFAWAKRYVVCAKVLPGHTYRVSVPYEERGAVGAYVVYGVLTLINGQGDAVRRFYLEKVCPGRMELIFSVKEETAAQIELGIKREGRAVWYRPCLQEWDGGEPKKRRMKIAPVCLQVRALSYEDNLKRIERAFDAAASGGADLVAFAETMNTRGVEGLAYEDSFETSDGRFCSLMKKKAREHSCYAFFSFRELDAHGARRNTAMLVDRNGNVAGKYHKTHLTLTEYENGMVPGEGYPVFHTEFGKVGMLVCWDAYFPEPARAMALAGARLLLITTAGNPVHRFIARAKENGVYVVASCPAIDRVCGYASTLVVDPCGNVLADTDKEGESATAEMDPDEKGHIFWLSLGPVDAVPDNVYRHEYRDDLYGKEGYDEGFCFGSTGQ